MSRDTFRDREGFGRNTQDSPGIWNCIGADELDHSIHCQFITSKGILPCSCDASRDKFSMWWQHWFRWQQVRVLPHVTERPLPWPVVGPDGESWVPGVDSNDGRRD